MFGDTAKDRYKVKRTNRGYYPRRGLSPYRNWPWRRDGDGGGQSRYHAHSRWPVPARVTLR